MKKSNEELFQELLSAESVEERKQIIFKDISKKHPIYKSIAESNPSRFFDLLGGEDNLWEEPLNWAFEWTADNAAKEAEESGHNFEIDAKGWNLEKESIKRANETGRWYVTSYCVIKGENNVELPFESEYCDGYYDKIIGTPYNTPIGGNSHGIAFY